ncbi:Hypothetical_protein [Hexamita inflata]|uniref:Hypothetical_protein n=1 Tax=Hexamita inflata TaxID=28002 RepID=A0AA86NCI2_9EUKA|nr:Hypothetical protein HINF_LOCUS4824 [Hexamita inflata]
MIFATTLAVVQQIMQSPGTATLYYQYSSKNAQDVTECANNYYLVMFDGTVQMKGKKYGLLNDASLDFVPIDIKFVSRIFCIQKQIMYLTQSGQLMKEDVVITGKLSFKQILTNQVVLDVQYIPKSDQIPADTTFVLTTDGFYIQENCQDYTCGVEDTCFQQLSKVTYPFTSKIVSFALDLIEFKNIFFYLENGDVYLTGKIDKFSIAQDSVPIRKIGSGFKSAYLGWNFTLAQNVLYYQKGNNIVMFSSSLTPNEQVIKTGVKDYIYFQKQFLIIKEEELELYFETAALENYETWYCAKNPTNPICMKIDREEYSDSDCSQNTDIACKLKQCRGSSLPECKQTQTCDVTNDTCWALWCAQGEETTKNTIECYINHLTSVDQLPLQNSQNSYFRNFMLYNPSGIKKNSNKVSPGGAAGIAIAACVVVFVLILTIVIVQLKKKQLNTAIATESTEVILPELTTAQSIEVQ